MTRHYRIRYTASRYSNPRVRARLREWRREEEHRRFWRDLVIVLIILAGIYIATHL